MNWALKDSLTRIKMTAIEDSLKIRKEKSDSETEAVLKNIILSAALLSSVIKARSMTRIRAYFLRWTFQVTKMLRKEALSLTSNKGEMPSSTRSTTSYQSN